ncbi:uncharacterized protein LOC127282276 [Leptopilina boulardi]|uniref:uncharacterized protein LOC127282276 n=1 Tax=Leptopilina boulardi TaxID=63433 RepID=UPI0021F69649|nr:uncharacterized protein LOC127282276 [Leptopilina boulardi]
MAEMKTQETLALFITQLNSKIMNSSRAKESPLNYLEARLSNLEDYWKDFYRNHWLLMSNHLYTDADYFKNSQYETIEEEYIATKAAIKREISKLTTLKTSNSLETSSQGNNGKETNFKHLPILTLPKFSGNQLEWETFRDLFTAMVDQAALSDVQKLYYLKSSLTGKAAERIKNLTVNENNYLQAWTMLVKRYDNQRILLSAHMRKLLSCPPASKRSVDDILRLLDTTNESIRAFSNMNRPVDLWDDWFVHILTNKLDPVTREEWEYSLKDSEDFPMYEELSSFFETTVRALEASHPIENSPKAQNNTKSKPQSNHFDKKSKKSQISVNHSQTETKPKSKACPLCQTYHYLSYCPQFKKLKVTQRSAQVQRLGLCSNCLGGTHKLDDCSSTKRCFVCSEKHHTFLHDASEHAEPGTSNQASSTSSEQASCNASYLSNHLANPVESQSRGIFATANIKLTSLKDKSITVKAFLDSGSERTLVTERVVQFLKLPKQKCDVSLKGIGNSTLGNSNYKVDLWLNSPKDPDFQLPINALVLKSLIQLLPKSRPEHSNWPHLADLDLADPHYYNQDPVDCVIGIDLLGHTLLPGLKQGPLNSPTGLLTTFGWIIFGRSISQSTDSQNCLSTLQVEEKDSLNQLLRAFWEVEELPKQTFLTNAELDCENLFKDTHYRNELGQYVVRLPVSTSPDQLGKSREQVVSMFLRTEKQHSKNPVAQSKYNDFIFQYIEDTHMRPVDENDSKAPFVNYIPHHVITKNNDPSSKIRVVFNGSFRTSSGLSLNEILHPGQKLQTDIWLIITRWRFWKYVFTCDIVKMFRQIRIEFPDCNLQRIVWRPDSNQPLVDYCLTTVTYGTRPAPFLAIRVLKQLALDEGENFPLGADVLINNTYVDDTFAGGDSLEEATQVRDEFVSILASAGISLSKWAANVDKLVPLDSTDGENKDKCFNLETSVSTLGLHWNPASDEFHYKVSPIDSSQSTKRIVASEIAKLYDPLGWLAPVLLRAKLLLQNCWLAGSDWDKALPINLCSEWTEFQHQLQQLNLVKIPRWINTENDHSNWELHGFSDASERAYSAAVYIVHRSFAGESHSNLIIAKTKLAPVKAISLPKLELCAATLLAKLTSVVTEKLNFPSKSIHYWSDSQIVLSWLQGHPSRWKPFVANRVSEIHSLAKEIPWRHVPSKDNPADCATRGFTVDELLNSTLWWHGPVWLLKSPDNWPVSIQVPNPNLDLEARSKFIDKVDEIQINVVLNRGIPELLSSVSSLTQLLRVTAYCLRFIQTLRNPNSQIEPYLTADELKRSFSTWIKVVQNDHLSETIELLKNKKPLPSGNPLIKLAPFLDNDEVLRVGGRLQSSLLSYDEMHPIILPKNSKLSALIITRAHLDALHGGQQLTLSRILKKFWIISSKTLINKIIRSCVKCFRFRANFQTQLMGQLPAERITISKPFTFTGLDYAGPFHILPSKGRGIRSTKGYICLFVCLCSRVIHLELVSNYETSGFLAAFKRFTSRRGQCDKILSDNARNFVGAARELRQLFLGASKTFIPVAELLANEGTTWSFIPPHSPHFGGIWEAGVKSVKHHLRRVVGETRMTFEELSTVLCQIEACLNSRPLYPNPSDANSLSAITPGHLLTGGPLVAIPEPPLFNENPSNRWSLITKMRDDFWNRWSHEYLHHLQQRSKWLVETNAVKIGDVVLLKEDNLPPTRWALARVQQLHPGPDGLPRVATIKTSTTTLKRAFSKLAVLPIREVSNEN